MSDDLISVPSLTGASSQSDEPSALTASAKDRLPHYSSLVTSMSELWLQQEQKMTRSMQCEAETSTVSIETSRKAITPESDLNLPNRHFHIVTTAALPWFTGTAVNPLLRAAYLHRRTQEINGQDHQWVTLVVPWLDRPEDQKETLGRIFVSQQEQDTYIRDWLRNEANMPDAASGLRILFYEARYHIGLGSIFAMGDLLQTIQGTGLTMDVCILEEPEHINWFRAPGDSWTHKYNYVIGVLHTSKSLCRHGLARVSL
jgi:digalactosyldiacylglycerol synthase